ncbi:MAG TPA: biotin-independent malonate decarboxylase subunit gamma [Casimicrobiaceae bacterium]|nr:biotin-independent malonate decarboxylase subunit gamma [Casimicrobiaceae bacterium]
MTLIALLDRLFPLGHRVTIDDQVVSGNATSSEGEVTLIGTCEHAEVGIEHALALADAVLASTRAHATRPIVMLVDTAGQRLSHGDELLGINAYLAHLAQCLEIARQRGARLISLVYGEAVSGGFLSFGLMADAIYALADAKVRVMNLQAMARVTKQPLERLEELARTSPVFAPGVANYVAMGAVQAIWNDDLAEHLATALREARSGDMRRRLGKERGGRLLTDSVVARITDGAH